VHEAGKGVERVVDAQLSSLEVGLNECLCVGVDVSSDWVCFGLAICLVHEGLFVARFV
jgi:hypothetical protein